MNNTMLIIAILSMIAAAVINVLLIMSERYCNYPNKNTYSEMTMAGTILMLLHWISTSQAGAYDAKWFRIIAVIYVLVFFTDALTMLMTMENELSSRKTIRAELRKSAITIAVVYFLFSYLVA